MGCLHQSPPLRAQLSVWKRRQKDGKGWRWWMTSQKQCLPDTTESMHIWTHRDCGSEHRAYTDSKQMGSQHWDGEVDIGSQPLQGAVTDTGKGKICLLHWSLTVYINHTPGQAPYSGVANTKKNAKYFCFILLWFRLTGLLPVCFDFCFAYFWFVSVCFLVCFCFLYLKDKGT